METTTNRRPMPRPRPRHPERPPRQPRDPGDRRVFVVAGISIMIVMMLFGLGHCAGSAKGERAERDAELARVSAENRAKALEAERDYYKQEIETVSAEASMAVEALTSELESATAAAERYKEASEDASAAAAAIERDNEELKKQLSVIKQQSLSKPADAGKTTTASYRTGGVERWRPLVEKYFGANTDAALSVMSKESGGDPRARNASGASGLFQQMPAYWPERIAAAEKKYRRTFSHDIFDPEANIAASAVLSRGGTSWSHWAVRP